MSWPHEDWGWGAWLGMSLGMVAFSAIVIWLVLTIVRTSRETAIPPHSPPKAIPSDLLANGEIDSDEYERRLDALRASHSSDATSKAGAQ